MIILQIPNIENFPLPGVLIFLAFLSFTAAFTNPISGEPRPKSIRFFIVFGTICLLFGITLLLSKLFFSKSEECIDSEKTIQMPFDPRLQDTFSLSFNVPHRFNNEKHIFDSMRYYYNRNITDGVVSHINPIYLDKTGNDLNFYIHGEPESSFDLKKEQICFTSEGEKVYVVLVQYYLNPLNIPLITSEIKMPSVDIEIDKPVILDNCLGENRRVYYDEGDYFLKNEDKRDINCLAKNLAKLFERNKELKNIYCYGTSSSSKIGNIPNLTNARWKSDKKAVLLNKIDGKKIGKNISSYSDEYANMKLSYMRSYNGIVHMRKCIQDFFIHEPERYDEINFYYVGEGVSKNNNRNIYFEYN